MGLCVLDTCIRRECTTYSTEEYWYILFSPSLFSVTFTNRWVYPPHTHIYCWDWCCCFVKCPTRARSTWCTADTEIWHGPASVAWFRCVCGAVDHGHSFSPDHLYGSGIVCLNASEWGDVDPIIIICYIRWRLYLCKCLWNGGPDIRLALICVVSEQVKNTNAEQRCIYRCVQMCSELSGNLVFSPCDVPTSPPWYTTATPSVRLSQRPSLVWYAATEHALLQSR